MKKIKTIECIEKVNLPPNSMKFRFISGDMYYRLRYKKLYDESKEKVSSMKNLYKNKRCFIIGTGPSLNKTRFEGLDDEYLFGVNTLYQGFERFGISPNFYVVGDPIIFNAHEKELLSLDSTLFLSGYAGRRFVEKYSYKESKNVVLIRPLYGEDGIFSNDISKGIYYGGTVTILALQIAYFLGFKEVYLIGCDCDYGGDHHFDKSKAENLKGMAVGEMDFVFSSYKKYKEIFEQDGRTIYNATVGGKLDVFKGKSLDEVLEESKRCLPPITSPSDHL